MGGASDEEGSDEMMKKVQELVQENVTSQEEYDQISKGFGGSLTYWKPTRNFWISLSRHIVVFLAILGFFFRVEKYRYWILGTSVLSVLLAWEVISCHLSELFIKFVPFYDKFRAQVLS